MNKHLRRALPEEYVYDNLFRPEGDEFILYVKHNELYTTVYVTWIGDRLCFTGYY